MPTAKAIVGALSLKMENSNLVRPLSPFNFSFSQNAQGLCDQQATVLHTAARTIPVGELVQPGFAYFRNLSAKYPVTFGVQLMVRLESVVTTSASTTVVCQSTTGLVAGMSITGTGIPTSTTISSVTNSTDFVISNAASGTYPAGNALTGTATLTGAITTNADPTVVCDSTTGLVAGMGITGTGIPGSTTVLSVTSGTEFELSANATVTQTGATLTATAALAAVVTKRLCKIVTCTSTAGIAAGTVISGTGIPTGAVVASIEDSTHFTMDTPASVSQGVAFAYGTAMVPVSDAAPAGFAALFLSEGAVPMARAHFASADVMPWIAES